MYVRRVMVAKDLLVFQALPKMEKYILNLVVHMANQSCRKYGCATNVRNMVAQFPNLVVKHLQKKKRIYILKFLNSS